MKYSIQNPYGEVYGIYQMPDTDKSSEMLAKELGAELEDIIGRNGVVSSPLRYSRHRAEDRVIIDIEPLLDKTDMDARLARVHQVIGKLAVRRQGSGQIRLIRPED